MSQTKNDKDFKMTKEVRLTLFLEAPLKYRGCFRVFALRFVIGTADYSNSLIRAFKCLHVSFSVLKDSPRKGCLLSARERLIKYNVRNITYS